MRSRRCANAVSVNDRRYRLVVEGELSDDIGDLFDGMTLTRQHGKTLLVGRVADQAELQGLLQRVTDLGLNLISATALDSEDI